MLASCFFGQVVQLHVSHWETLEHQFVNATKWPVLMEVVKSCLGGYTRRMVHIVAHAVDLLTQIAGALKVGRCQDITSLSWSFEILWSLVMMSK